MALRRHLSSILVAAAIATLTVALAVARQGRLEAEARARAQALAASSAQSLASVFANAEHRLLEARAASVDVSGVWRFEASSWHAPPAAMSRADDIGAALDAGGANPPRDGSVVIGGPYVTARGESFLFMMRRAEVGATALGVLIPVSELLDRIDLAGLVRQGYQVRIAGRAPLPAIYHSDLAIASEPVVASLPRPWPGLTVDLAAREGWTSPVEQLPLYLTALLLAVAGGLYHARLREEPGTLQGALDREGRRFAVVNKRLSGAVRELEELRRGLDASALRDPLTGLANRTACLASLDHLLAEIRRGAASHATLLVVGLNNLHRLAHVHGRTLEAKLLHEIGRRLRHLEVSTREVWSVGEGRFAMTVAESALPDDDAATAARTAAQTVLCAMEQPFHVGEQRLHVDAAVGMTRIDNGHEYADELLDRAQLAMVEAVERRGDPVCEFEPRVMMESADRLQLEGELKTAIEQDALELWYEPILDVRSMQVRGLEALVRWQHPRLGLIPPVRFLGVARGIGLMPALDRLVLRAACRQAAQWHREMPRRFFMHVNISAESFLRPRLAEDLAELLAEAEIPGETLRLEIVEGTVLQDISRAADLVGALAELGVGVWLDDFGTGYSSLSYLKALPAQGVKLDRSFVEHISLQSRDYGLMKAIVDLLRYLEMGCIAEGVETREQLELVGLADCELFQGHLVQKGVPAVEARQLLADTPPLARVGT